MGKIVEMLRDKDALIRRLKTCPVCEELDNDGLEACSKCYNSHFASTLKLDKFAYEAGKLNGRLKLKEAQLARALDLLTQWVWHAQHVGKIKPDNSELHAETCGFLARFRNE